MVKGFSLKLRKGEFYAILGGNGAGKSTTLKVISGLRSAYRGDVRLQGKLGHLPQNPQTLFVKRTVRDDLYEVFRGEKIPKEKQDAEVARIVELCGLREFLDRHPYDISGGEQQRTALAKVLLTQPDNRITFHNQPRLFYSLKDVFDYVKRHDDHILAVPMGGTA